MTVRLDEAEKQILGTLLADFSDRNLNADHLNSGYEGPKVSDLAKAICAGDDITQVDFDIALSDLEKKNLINTGPYEAYKNEPGDRLIIIGGYSKREYAGLTELGYKTARQSTNRPSKVQRIINNVHISGGQFSNLQLATGGSVVQRMDSVSGTDSDILVRLVAILEKQGEVVSIEQREILVSAIAEASEGNGKEAKRLLEKVCGPAWTAVQPVIWPIFGDLLKKSLGL
ncbi:hypothetical protein DM872_02425 [Pseudomonas taiwanensis]|uniref:hypothetical protein n=1 Tax=Pseudomonas TaxID=286 RepID=UPI0015BF14B3|nr:MULTISPECIES: hypothetical protein [Pseudomonas]MDH4564412.1 hypothetical protein [Pseudomonas sp. BN411]MDH4656738.1 hypothetical protein [Pseudomonas sp. BN606]MDH4874068.1 hypothetical protein [Pseudomonas sp. BN515]NWL75700.1 hypothetical protein [Pseudomonas taiwanensis]